ncbi:low molecular weight protein arginine phosphatase [Paraliobacillus sediminis]|uniref:low molecular weight protein arginine phosphatase n=1 Tax=Paraliobacillus sediminis TaxID=1885916 RepID=UPI000E3E0E5C|nr:low molecular weight protein arginine phosphatase [Paraliobacillus sediminis]
MKNVLFICTGNTCRSPMAEALLKHKSNFEVKSAGIFASNGSPASQGTIDALQTANIKVEHQSQPVSEQLLDWADLILTMTMQHKQTVTMQYPQVHDKTYTLKEYTLLDGQSTWEQLKKAYVRLEEKRALVVAEKDQNQSEQQLRAFLREDQDEIDRLEAELPNFDISDPYGGDAATYQQTLEEMDKYVDLLIETLDNTDN